MSNTYDNFAEQIGKTGFVLENRIAQALKAAKWTVISNRYYVDDHEESVREIDLIAYKISKMQHFEVCTTLVISCKKSEGNAWALLARQIDLKDPNAVLHPLHAWSNDKALSFRIESPGCGKRFHEEVSKLGADKVLQTPEVDIFAFQEMKKVNGTPQNDKAIFAAVTTLMKAQAYELGALPNRKKSPCVYQFNLVSVVDAPLVRLMFSEENVEACEIKSEQYNARYIIQKQETSSRIRFINSDSFADSIGDYEALHKANHKWFGSECDAFYQNVVEDHKRVDVFIIEFREAVAWRLGYSLRKKKLKAPKLSEINLSWNNGERVLVVHVPGDDETESTLNDDSFVRDGVKEALGRFYRYDGPFKFSDDIPF